MYEYKWRHYDTTVGRFFAVDPLAPDFPHWSPYVFSGNFVTTSQEMEGLEPKFMIYGENGLDSDNHVTPAITSLISSAFGYSASSIKSTVWVTETDPRASWFSRQSVPDNAVAITTNKTVVFDKSLQRDSYSKSEDEYWFQLIVHEHKHRDDIDKYGATFFYKTYVLSGASVLGVHDNIDHEKTANKYEEYAAQLWTYLQNKHKKYLKVNMKILLTDYFNYKC